MSESTERVRRHRERQRHADEDAGKPWEGLVGDEREQAIRKHHGYASSEKRTQLQRQQAADRITAKSAAVQQTMLKGTWQQGYDKQPCPVAYEPGQSLSGEERVLMGLWADGLRQRQAEEERARREYVRAEAIAHPGSPPIGAPPSEEQRAQRAAAYRDWLDAGKPSRIDGQASAFRLSAGRGSGLSGVLAWRADHPCTHSRSCTASARPPPGVRGAPPPQRVSLWELDLLGHPSLSQRPR